MKELPKYALNYLKGYKYLLKKRKVIGKTDRYFFFEYFQKWLKQLKRNNSSTKKGVIIYGPRCIGKTIFCKSLVSNSEKVIYQPGGICKSEFDEKKTTAELIIMDSVLLSNFNKNFIKKLLNNRVMTIVDKKDDWYLKLPVIIIVNEFEHLLFYLNDDICKNKCSVILCNEYIGPKGTEPDRTPIKPYITTRMQKELDEYEAYINKFLS